MYIHNNHALSSIKYITGKICYNSETFQHYM